MDHQRTTTIEPTLDPVRTDQLRTFLTVEAAADAAASSVRTAGVGRRRLVGGIAAAVLLGGGLFAAASIAGGPSSGPAAVQTASAVAIEPAAPGWLKISISDVDADPEAVVDQLTAAGIDARREPLAVQRDDQGRLTLGSFDATHPDGGGFSMVGLAGSGDPGDRGLAGLTVSAPDAGPSPLSDDTPPEEAEQALNAYLETIGARFGSDGSLEIRTDADVTVLVLAED